MKKKIVKRVSTRFKINNEPVVTDFSYWLTHAFHWCALLFAIAGILVVGYTLFNNQSVEAEEWIVYP